MKSSNKSEFHFLYLLSFGLYYYLNKNLFLSNPVGKSIINQ